MTTGTLEVNVEPPSKRSKLSSEDKVFADGLFSKEAELTKQIEESAPYKHGVINPLFDDDLLKKVRSEIESQLHFSKKETDIYKVFQTGDLANISALGDEELKKIESLAKLRDGLYSKEFRDFLSRATNSGPLSGLKKDLSINVYQKGCHLLNHDDVIGTRRISYILYLVEDPWNEKWGGALRLFPTLKANIPATDWTKSIPPHWNQLAFFKVQPGLSFHDVEEVYVDKPRLSISGWFHIPQEGEEGYVEGEKEEGLSSLKQLEVTDDEFDFPKKTFSACENEIGDDDMLSDDDKKYLSTYLDGALLDSDDLSKLSDSFCENSMITLKPFLNKEYAQKVKKTIEKDDLTMPTTSDTITRPWDVARPPHKARYMYLDSSEASGKVKASGENETTDILQEVTKMFKSEAFMKWLKQLSTLTPIKSYALARRFRPGYDFTLATTSDSPQATLEAVLNLTPSKGWKDGEVGGYDLAMTVDDEAELDPAVYRSGNDQDDEDGLLFNNQIEFNSLSLIVRDEGILRFIKYVSKNAPGSRWDISCEWQVKNDEEEDSESGQNEEEPVEKGENGN